MWIGQPILAFRGDRNLTALGEKNHLRQFPSHDHTCLQVFTTPHRRPGLELTVVYGTDGGRSVRSTALAIDELAQPTPAVLVEVGVTGDLPEEPA